MFNTLAAMLDSDGSARLPDRHCLVFHYFEYYTPGEGGLHPFQTIRMFAQTAKYVGWSIWHHELPIPRDLLLQPGSNGFATGQLLIRLIFKTAEHPLVQRKETLGPVPLDEESKALLNRMPGESGSSKPAFPDGFVML